MNVLVGADNREEIQEYPLNRWSEVERANTRLYYPNHAKRQEYTNCCICHTGSKLQQERIILHSLIIGLIATGFKDLMRVLPSGLYAWHNDYCWAAKRARLQILSMASVMVRIVMTSSNCTIKKSESRHVHGVKLSPKHALRVDPQAMSSKFWGLASWGNLERAHRWAPNTAK